MHDASPFAFVPLKDDKNVDWTTDAHRELIKHRALALGSLASRHFFEGEPLLAVRACQRVAEMGPRVREAKLTPQDVNMPWSRIVQGAAQCESMRRDGELTIDGDDDDLPCNLVYAVLNAMTTFPSDNDNATYEKISNALVRRVVFVTGAVDLKGCPPSDRGEAAFIGRSNVGKSSLVNMVSCCRCWCATIAACKIAHSLYLLQCTQVTNRKSLAYTSKTPGKTQQFNFFAVNDKPSREREIRFGDVVEGEEKDADSLYLVDLPGFGFAKVPEEQRRRWSVFMEQYLTSRPNLRVLFHLVDARHGPTEEDERVMALVGRVLPRQVRYVVVLTKADKNTKSRKRNAGRVSRTVLEDLRATLKAHRLGHNTPVLLSSAESKLGRDDLWRYLRLAAEG